MAEKKEIKETKETTSKATPSNNMASLATPIAIVIAGLIIAGAVIYTNGFGGFSKSAPAAGTSNSLGSKYQKYIDLAVLQKLDEKKFSACMDKFDTTEIKKDLAEAATYGANGTPAFFIGKSANGTITGIRIPGAYPIETFKGVIDGLNEDNDQKIIEALGPDQEGNLAKSVADISAQVSLDDDPVKGNADAPITIIEFSDYECPFCQRHFNSTYPQIVSEYLDTGKAKLVFRDLPLSFHDPVATQAAVAANCAREQGGDEAYFKFHDEYYSRTKANGQGL
jgi:protein-disulfide isomerase